MSYYSSLLTFNSSLFLRYAPDLVPPLQTSLYALMLLGPICGLGRLYLYFFNNLTCKNECCQHSPNKYHI